MLEAGGREIFFGLLRMVLVVFCTLGLFSHDRRRAVRNSHLLGALHGEAWAR